MPFLTQAFTFQPVGDVGSGSAARMRPSFRPDLSWVKASKASSPYSAVWREKSSSIFCSRFVTVLSSARSSPLCFKLLNHRRSKFFGGIFPTQVRRSDAAFSRNRLQCLENGRSGFAFAQVLHHQGSCPDSRDGVRNAAAFDIGSAAMHRLEDRGSAALGGIQIGARRKTQAPLQRAAQIGEDIGEKI